MNLNAQYLKLFESIEQDLLAYLQSDAIMGCRAGVVIDPGSILSVVESKVEAALGAGPDGKVGDGFLILPIEELFDDTEVEFGAMKIPIGIQLVQNVILSQGPNGRKQPLRALAAYMQKILKAYSAVNLFSALKPADPAISLFTPARDENLRVCQINFTTYESDVTQFQQVDSPWLTTPGVIVSPTPGGNVYPIALNLTLPPNAEAVYYTTDGSPPWPGLVPAAGVNYKPIITSAQKWDGRSAVPIPGPCLFRARGFAPVAGHVGSKTSSIYFA